jgi:hypothetical protein
MPAFTILNCGTNFDRTKRGELIADFGAEMSGVEYQNFLITDGVGSTGAQMPGSFDPYTKGKTSKGTSPQWSQTPMGTLSDVTQSQAGFSPTGHGVIRGMVSDTGSKAAAITGDGWDDNIRHALAVIADVFPALNGTINMIGWSRGAVTCLRMANWIREFLGDGFTINIFAVDPVAGLDAGVRLHDTYFIPPNVRNYVAILALDEMRGDFKPQDLSRLQVANILSTNVAFLPFPGVHNTVVTQKKSGLPEVTAVVRALAYRFLTQVGTTFSVAEPVPAHAQMCVLYGKMLAKRKKYRKLGGSMKDRFMGGIVERGVRTNVQSYVGADAHFFINEHHRRCFELAWQNIYTFFFTARVAPPGSAKGVIIPQTSPLGQDLTQLKTTDPDSFKMLSELYGIKAGTTGGATWQLPGAGIGVAGIPAPPSSAAAVNLLV